MVLGNSRSFSCLITASLEPTPGRMAAWAFATTSAEVVTVGISAHDTDCLFDAVDVGSASVNDGETKTLQLVRLVPVTNSGGSSRSM